MAPTVTVEQLKSTTGAELRRYEAICDEYFEEENWRAHGGATSTPPTTLAPPVSSGTEVMEIVETNENLFQLPLLAATQNARPHRGLSAQDLSYRSNLAKRDFEKAVRESDRRLKWLQVEDREYNDKRRRYDDLLKAHDQWVAVLKESIDPHEASLLLSKQASFYQMIDDLQASCNSRCRLDMHEEWDRNWARTEQVFPVDLVLWTDLRDRYFLIHDGNPADLETRLAEIFKRRFLSVVPWDEHSREYGPLALTLQAEKMNGENSMSSGMLLESIEAIERARAYDSSRLSKSSKRKAVSANQVRTKGTFKPCPRHPKGKHTDEECNGKDKPIPQAGKRAPKRQRQVKFEGMDSKGKQQPVPKSSALKKDSTIATGDRLEILERKFDAYLAQLPLPEATPAKHVQILKAAVQRKLFYLNHLSDADLLSNPIVLDSGASRHVAPIKLELTD
jgi:hypothetical protein